MNQDKGKRRRVCIAWSGLPLYAAAGIAAAIESSGHEISVIGTRPAVPTAGMADVIGRPIKWIEVDQRVSFLELGLSLPDIVFVTGWAIPSFMRLASQARRAGGKVVCMADNSFRGDARQWLGAVAYRLAYRRFYDHVWVPGKSAAHLMRFYGVPTDRISQGLYTADTSVFQCETALASRPLRFVFAGQFIERKNLLRMCAAFLRFRRRSSRPCELHLYGAGPLRDRIPDHPDIHVHGFATPSRLSAALNAARCLILPSLIDHWGLVVHEAAACGVLLIVSDATGAAEDLCGPTNSRVIRAASEEDMVNAFEWAACLNQTDLTAASQESVERAAAFSVPKWAATFSSICGQLQAG
jgi:glycosyltransferase involved in cell wall biosynthesis